MASVSTRRDGTEVEYLTCAETAKRVRAALKREYPACRFSVRSHTYAGGASINIHWTDGPTAEQVDRIAHRYEGAQFDGMTDLKSYVESATEWADDPEHDGRPIHYGADYVFTHRHYSADLLLKAGNPIAHMHAVIGWAIRPDDGYGASLAGADPFIPERDEYFSRLVMRAASRLRGACVGCRLF